MDFIHLTLPVTPALIAHIIGGSVAVIAGFTALFARKGAPLHRVAGTLFLLAMLVMASAALYMAMLKSQATNIMAGGVAIYLVLTAWVAARRADGRATWFELAAALAAGGLSAFAFVIGALAIGGDDKMLAGAPPAAPFVFGSVIALAALSDLSVVLRRGVSGVQRIARHLWRMCFAMVIAVGSFAVQGKMLLPPALVKLNVLGYATLLVLALLVFWLVRVFFTGWYKKTWSV